MTTLPRCSACAGFLPPAARSCPHCDSMIEGALTTGARRVVGRVAKALFTLSAGSTFAVTLMACYGMPPCEPEDDMDGDGASPGFCTGQPDCDDTDATIFPGAEDLEGDGIDQNCDGVDGVAVQDAGPADDSGVVQGQEQDYWDAGASSDAG